MQIDATYDEVVILAKWNSDQARLQESSAKAHEKRAQDFYRLAATPRTITTAGLDGIAR